MPLRSISLCLLALVLPSVGCDDGGYTVVVRFRPETLAEQARRIQIAIVPACGDQVLGAEPWMSLDSQTIERGAAARSLGSLRPGTYGLYARASDASCQWFASGCDPIEVKAAGKGVLSVGLTSRVGPGCEAGTTCVDGVCRSGDFDAGPRPDGGAPECPCAPCACAPDGSCLPEHELCAAGEYCDIRSGCRPAQTCMTDEDCPPIESCRSWYCERRACLPALSADGAPCTDGSGQCRFGECCLGCWDGRQCQAGDEPAACGVGGVECGGCDDDNPCTTDSCRPGGGCDNLPMEDGRCPGGVCIDGTCCTGCLTGEGQCRVDSDRECGAGGGECITCDAGACPLQGCLGGACGVVGASQVDLDSFHACAIGENGGLYCWGDNGQAQLGSPAPTSTDRPVRVTSARWERVATGLGHTCAIRRDGSLHCAGEGSQGRLGLGDDASRASFTRVGEDADWQEISAGHVSTCGIRTDGTLWCWGGNDGGQLGLGDTTERLSPTRVGAEIGWAQVSVRREHACAIGAGGVLFCWGENSRGELGLGDTESRFVPTAVVGGPWASVSTGGSPLTGGGFTCATTTTDELWCWGANDDGQLGDGTLEDARTPTRSAEPSGWASVSAGAVHACGVRSDGRLFCWGEGGGGQTGLGGADTEAPTFVVDAITAVTAGSESSCAIRADRRVLCFGQGGRGQLGSGSRVDSRTPNESCL